MKRQWNGCSASARGRRAQTHSPRRGTTLIEVLAGLVVLGTLLTSVAMARGRFLRTWADADKRLRAAKAADVMLEKWLAGPSDAISVPASGSLDGSPGCTWRTVLLRDPSAAKLQAVIVRLQVYEAGGETKSLILTVDFLRHEYPPQLRHSVPANPGGMFK